MKFQIGDRVRLKNPENYGPMYGKDPIGVINGFQVDINMYVVCWSEGSGVLRYYGTSLVRSDDGYGDFEERIKDRLG